MKDALLMLSLGMIIFGASVLLLVSYKDSGYDLTILKATAIGSVLLIILGILYLLTGNIAT